MYNFLGFSFSTRAFENSIGGGPSNIDNDSKESLKTLTQQFEESQTNRRAVITELVPKERKDTKNDDYMEPSIIDKVDLLTNDPLYISMSQFLEGYELGRNDVDKMLLSTLDEVETRNKMSLNEPLDLKNYFKLQVKRENNDESNYRRSDLSLITGPYMSITVEENNCIKRLVDNTQQILKRSCPVSLYQARVGQFMGTLSMEDMLKLFTISRKAQNSFHFKTMTNVPFFNELTTR